MARKAITQILPWSINHTKQGIFPLTILMKRKLALIALMPLLLIQYCLGQGIGNLDPSFYIGVGANNGFGVNGPVNAIEVATDGKIYVGGNFSMYNNVNCKNLVRLNTDGSVDETFAYPTAMPGPIYALKLQGTDKLLVGGEFGSYNGTPVKSLVRLNTNGDIDPDFKNNCLGFTMTKFIDTTINNIRNLLYPKEILGGIKSLAVDAAGKILVGGTFVTFKGTQANNTRCSRLARLNSNGSLDVSFSGAASDAVLSIIPLPDGKTLIAGQFCCYSGSRGQIARINSNGSVDNSFNQNSDRSNLSGANGYVNSMKRFSNGKILIGGQFTKYNETTMSKVALLNSNGTLDSSFSNPSIGGNVNCVEIDASQNCPNVIVGGNFTLANGNNMTRLARLYLNGGLLFPSIYPVSGPNNTVNVIKRLSDGKILVAGEFTNFNNVSPVQMGLVRLASSPIVTGVPSFCSGGSTILTSSAPSGNLWSTGATTQSITVNAEGTYSVSVVSGSCGTEVSAPVTVTINAPTPPTIDGTNNFCSGGSTVLTSSATSGNLWSTGATTQSITVTGAGNYSVRVISASCTSASTAVTVNPIPTAPTVTPTNPAATCGTAVTLTASASEGNTYQWKQNGTNISGATSSAFSAEASGNYTVVAVTPQGCTSAVSNSISVTVNPIPTAHTVTPTNPAATCGTAVNLAASASEGNTYQWKQNGTNISGATSSTFSAEASGNYAVVAVTPQGCTSAVSNSISVTVNQIPNALTITNNQRTCIAESLILTASDVSTGLSYLWSNGATTQSITINEGGSYSVRTIQGDCTSGISNAIEIIPQTAYVIVNGGLVSNTPTNNTPTRTTPKVNDAVRSSNPNLSLDNEGVIPFEIQSNNRGEITISSKELSGCTFSLFNEQTGEVIPNSETYNFNVGVNQPYRFQLQVNPLAANENKKASIFQVYPNPATGKVTVKTNNTGTIQILDLVGKVVLTQPATGSDELNISKLTTGVYTVKVGNATRKLVVK